MERFGRYQLVRRVGAGGMAEVFEARLEAGDGFEKTLALKRILPHLTTDSDLISMFRDEVRLMVRLSHPNIVQTFDFGRIGESYFLAMEFVEGRDLRSILARSVQRGAKIPLPFALHVAAEVLKGLEYAHDRTDPQGRPMGLVHRDATPSNILVSYEGAVKIVDFGIAKTLDSRESQTKLGYVKGKASYLAPEQLASGGPIDARVDIFTIGVVLWEMLVGRKLFAADNELGAIHAILQTPIDAPSKVDPAIPPDIDAAVLKALERDPGHRFQSAGEMAEELALLYRRHGGRAAATHHGRWVKRLFPEKTTVDSEKGAALPDEPLRDDSQPTMAIPGLSPPSGWNSQLPAALEFSHDSTRLSQSSPSRTAEPSQQPEALPAPLGEPEGPRGAAAKRPVVFAGVLLSLALGVGFALRTDFTDQPESDVQPSPTVSAVSVAPFVIASVPSVAPASPIAVTTPSPAPRSKQRPSATLTPRTMPVVASAAVGTLNLNSTPWGDIFIDGKPLGRQTPAFGLRLPAGEHEIRIVNPIQKSEARLKVHVESGQVLNREVQLKSP